MMLNLHMPAWTKSRTITQLYSFYRHRKNKLSPNHVDKKKFTSIGKDFFLLLQEHLLNGKVYYPPHGMGEFRINKFRRRENKRPRNYKLEKEHFEKTGVWKKIFIQNFHTDGYTFKISWITRDYTRIPARRVYRFDKNRRNFTVKLKKYLLTTGNSERYVTVNKRTRINKVKTLI